MLSYVFHDCDVSSVVVAVVTLSLLLNLRKLLMVKLVRSMLLLL